jgi:hypothetical protein
MSYRWQNIWGMPSIITPLIFNNVLPEMVWEQSVLWSFIGVGSTVFLLFLSALAVGIDVQRRSSGLLPLTMPTWSLIFSLVFLSPSFFELKYSFKFEQ